MAGKHMYAGPANGISESLFTETISYIINAAADQQTQIIND